MNTTNLCIDYMKSEYRPVNIDFELWKKLRSLQLIRVLL